MVTAPEHHSDRDISVDDMDFVGGELCLDLVNTGSSREEGPFRERLREYDDLVRWGLRLEALDGDVASRLQRAAARDPAGAAGVLERARALREAIYRVFRARLSGDAPSSEDLALLTAAGAEATAAQRLVCRNGSFELEFGETENLNRAWWPAATSALELLLSEDLTRVKECATPDCNWLFVDASKNRSRRWCEMSECGNRAKAQRHYARRKKKKKKKEQ